MKKIAFLTLLLIMNLLLFSQNPAKNKKIEKLYKQARYAYTLEDYLTAEDLCKKIIKKDKNFTSPYILLAQIYANQNKNLLAARFMKQAIATDTNFAQAYLFAAQLLLDAYSLDSSVIFARKSLSKGLEKQQQNLARKIIRTAEFRKTALQNKKNIDVRRLPATVNTYFSEYFPTISGDGKTLIFTRLLYDANYGFSQEDIFYSRKIDSVFWTEAKPFINKINTQENEGAHTFTPDGKVMIFTRCILGESCDLYITERIGDAWANPVKLPYPVNTKYWETQPCLAPDGKTLYFVSNRPGGKGMADIWKTVYLGDGKWSKPENLGDSINTNDDDLSPFIAFDNKTLYFASRGHIGLGGFDLFMAKKKPGGKWSKPVNLGFPINTKQDDYRLIVDFTGKTAYYSSFVDSLYKQDIFTFTLPADVRPHRTVNLKVRIFNALTQSPIKANYLIINLKTNDTIYSGYDNSFLVCLPENGDFAINILPGKNFLFYSENINLAEFSDTTTLISKDILLEPIVKGKKLILSNVFFDFDKATLKPESFAELDKLADFLKQNKTVKIEIGGHTDNKGSYDYNMKLSEQRAKAVADYLIRKGIDKNRITYKGYGYTKPIASNDTEEGRQMNRRTEITILSH